MSQNVFDIPAWPTLKRLNSNLQALVSNTCSASVIEDISDHWETTYDLVFSDALSKPIYQALRELNQRLDYYDPDSSYEDDVLAFASAVEDKVQQLQVVLINGDTYEP